MQKLPKKQRHELLSMKSMEVNYQEMEQGI